MAISASNITTGSDVVAGSSTTTASVSPASNNLILLTVTQRTGITANPNQPTATGNGLTWVVVNSVVFDTTSSSRRRVTVLRAMGASPSSGAITIDCGGQTQTGIDWSVDQFSGVDTTGTNGSGAIVQSATNFDASGTASTLSVTLAAFSSTNNATFGGWGQGNPASTTATAGSGFTLLGDETTDVTDCKLTTEWKSTNDTGVDISYSQAGEIGGVAIEIKATVASTIYHRIALMGVG